MPNTLGTPTTSKFHIDPEAHKLSISFVVETGQTVNKGDAVVLTATGTVQSAALDDERTLVIGYSMHDGLADEEVTVVMRGYTVVNAEAAADSLDAGIVKLGAYNGTTGLREYVAGGAEPDLVVGHNLTQAATNGDAIKVCLL